MAEVVTKNQATISLIWPKKPTYLSGVRYFFSTRRGGVSQGGYASLNLGGHVADDSQAVAINRQHLLMAAKMAAKSCTTGRGVESVCYLNQVHGTTTVEASDWSTPPDADAMVTQKPGVVLAILTADCAPVLFVDYEARVIGAAHAGWRGSCAGVLESCLDAMIRLGARRRHIDTMIGPCIRRDSYQVDPPFVEAFQTHSGNKVALAGQNFFSKQKNVDKLLFDLPRYICERLEIYGLLREKIDDVLLCTYQKRDDFFSHRRATQSNQAPCGRQVGGVFLE